MFMFDGCWTNKDSPSVGTQIQEDRHFILIDRLYSFLWNFPPGQTNWFAAGSSVFVMSHNSMKHMSKGVGLLKKEGQ